MYLYVLGTRLYDPNNFRFVSPDRADVITETPEGLTDKNLYAYCDNNPIMRVDHDGESWLGALIGAAVGAAVGFVSDVATQLTSKDGDFKQIDWGSALNSTIVGGATGLSTALGVSFLGPVIAGAGTVSAESAAIAATVSTGVSAIAGAVGHLVQEKINRRFDEKTFSNALKHSAVVAVEGLVSFGVGGMLGSFESIGMKGKFPTKEWRVKFVIGQEFSLPFKYSLDKLRKGLW